MCTVTYLPLKDGKYILTSSRDEKITRPSAQVPQEVTLHDQTLLYPMDPLHQGTWFACSEKGRVVCLLNGAFTKHRTSPPYRKSRGLVVLDAFHFRDANDFIISYDFKGIEPFTIIFLDKNEFCEIRWDADKITLKELSQNKSYIWSSVTLYSEEVIEKRQGWFENWRNLYPDAELKEVLDFHLFAGEGDVENDVKMNRNNEMQTLSITSLYHDQEYGEMIHKDLISNTGSSQRISHSSPIQQS